MRILITGGRGFVGRWLVAELEAAGHEVVAPSSSELDVRDESALRHRLADVGPDGVVHLAAVSFGPDARENPGRAFAVNVGGTVALYEALRASGRSASVLVVGSSEEYGAPVAADLPLNESAPLRPGHPYAHSKVAQEMVALELGRRYRLPTVVTRSFNHAGPGQRPVFAVPAFATRVEDVRRGAADRIHAGNVDVRRDISDVRDVVVAYRLLLEALAVGSLPEDDRVYNVASGTALRVREWIEMLLQLAGVDAPIEVDPSLMRPDDPIEIRGDATRLRAATGWTPSRTLENTLADVLASVRGALPPG
ncbi:MAG TPA: GDP-mannose 4,6-dehydratase [Candidatus Limnocylindrales bacterium]|nr:GDP-mannose 4,6-dehydratase [Candidatus Limnocylindrales bacterium]